MIYVDACYLAKIYLFEVGTAEVRELVADIEVVVSCIHARGEFFTAVHRHLREGRLTSRAFHEVLDDFERDCADGFWEWLPMTSKVIDRVASTIRALPSNVFIRAGDAIHLACAAENGFAAVYSNDSHLHKAASHFGVRAINVFD